METRPAVSDSRGAFKALRKALLWTAVPALLLPALLVQGCGAQRKTKRAAAAQDEIESGEEVRLPDYVLGGVTHTFYQKGVLRLKVTFERGEYFTAEGRLAVENCMYVYYDNSGRVLSRGKSKRARFSSNRANLIAEEDVVVISELNGGVLETEYLEWSGDRNQFTTEDFVTITRTNGDRIHGKGMIADLALRTVTIKRNVKGHFSDEQNPS
jgi:LPS export ABC transporter protein LptC